MNPLPREVFVNGQARRLKPGARLDELVAELGYAPHAVATAVNGEFVARGQRRECVLRDGEHVSCFQPIVGG